MAKTFEDIIIKITDTIEQPINLGDEPYRKCGIPCWVGKDENGNFKDEGIQWVYSFKEALEYIDYGDPNGNYWVKAFFDQLDNNGNTPIGCYLVMMKPKEVEGDINLNLVVDKVPDLTNAPFETLVLAQIDFDNNIDFVESLNFTGKVWLSLGDLKNLPTGLEELKNKDGYYIFYDKKGYLDDNNNAYALPCRVAGMFFRNLSGGFPHVIYSDIVGFDGQEEKTTDNYDILSNNNINFAFQSNGVLLFSLIDLKNGEQALFYYNEQYIKAYLRANAIAYIKNKKPMYNGNGFAQIKAVLNNSLTDMASQELLEGFSFVKFPVLSEIPKEDQKVQKLSGILIGYRINGQMRFVDLSLDVVL